MVSSRLIPTIRYRLALLVALALVPVGYPQSTEFVRGYQLAPSQAKAGGAAFGMESRFLDINDGVSAPDTANLKVGRAYFTLDSTSGSVLYSDNVDFVSSAPKSGTISVFRIAGGVQFLATERLQLATSGTLVYLPRQQQAGIAGLGVEDPLAEIYERSSFRAQLSYETRISDWDVQLVDEFSAAPALPTVGGFGGTNFAAEDRVGRYTFREQTRFPAAGSTNTSLIRENLLGGIVTRSLPTDTRVSAGLNRFNFWYTGPIDRQTNLPDTRDRGFISIASERENLRLKPFSRYQIERNDTAPWNHEIQLGVAGPLTDYVDLIAFGGYFWAENAQSSGRIWGVSLRHTPRELTRHEIRYSRALDNLTRELETQVRYNISQGLTSSLSTRLGAFHTEFESLRQPGPGGREWGASLGLDAAVIAKGRLTVESAYFRQEYNGIPADRSDGWLGRIRMTYGSLEGDLIYRHSVTNPGRPLSQARENVMSATLLKRF